MAKMIIDIPDGCYEELNNGQFPIQDAYRLVAWIKEGTPLPNNATNGDIIQNICSMWIEYYDTAIEVTIDKEVWDRPYKKGDTDGNS